jgi:hypothetical protein
MARGRLKTVASVCLGMLVFLQLAVAAYACPTSSNDPSSIATGSANAPPPCQGMDLDRAKLCEQHCVQGSQSVDTQPHTVAAPASQLLAMVALPDVRKPIAADVRNAVVTAAASPPLLIRFGVLRI